MAATDGHLPVEIPLFPLPNVVLFPGAVVPLHIFEPRYRQMVRRCLDGDGVFGMVLIREGDCADEVRPVAHCSSAPPLYSVGAAGRIVGHHPLPDGRSYILVKGLARFRIGDLDDEQPYLTARVAYLRGPKLPTAQDDLLQETLCGAFAGYLECCSGDTAKALTRARSVRGAAEAADVIASCIDLPPAQRQALLEVLDPAERCEALLREMQQVSEEHAVTQATRRSGWPPPDFSWN